MATTIRRMTTRSLTAVVALGLAVGMFAFSPDGAFAKPVPPGGDSHQMGCKSLQDRAQALVDEYGAEGTTNARREEILQELRNIGSDWVAIKCKARYGSIFMEVPVNSYGKVDGLVSLETAGMYTEPTTSSTSKTQVFKTATVATFR